VTADVRRLRAVREGGAFAYRRARLSPFEAKRVKETVARLRTDRVLPADTDARDLMEPADWMWSRRVPDTSLWVLFKVSEDDAVVIVRAIKNTAPWSSDR